MFAVLLVLLLAGGAQSVMLNAPRPDWSSRLSDDFRPIPPGAGAALPPPVDPRY